MIQLLSNLSKKKSDATFAGKYEMLANIIFSFSCVFNPFTEFKIEFRNIAEKRENACKKNVKHDISF